MAKQNAELITETAEALLQKIKERAGLVSLPGDIKALSEAFALVAEHDTTAAAKPSRVR